VMGHLIFIGRFVLATEHPCVVEARVARAIKATVELPTRHRKYSFSL
jgi:hypothetical protein